MRTIVSYTAVTRHVTRDLRRLAVGAIWREVEFVHRDEDPPLYRLQAVARIGKRAVHDHAHRVIEVRVAELVLEIDVNDVAAGCNWSVVCHEFFLSNRLSSH
jgi:hypothetical protein